MRFDELSIDEKNYVQGVMSSLGVNAAYLPEPEIERVLSGRPPVKSSLTELAEANQKTAGERAIRRRQAAMEALQDTALTTPDLDEITQFALAYGLNVDFAKQYFADRQEAAVAAIPEAREELRRAEAQREFDEAADKARQDDYLELILIGDNSRHPWQQQAKALMGELWPGYDNWR